MFAEEYLCDCSLHAYFPAGIEMEIVNSCESDNGGCLHHCQHGTTGPVCSCNHGYQLDEDLKNCVGQYCCFISYVFVYFFCLFTVGPIQ